MKRGSTRCARQFVPRRRGPMVIDDEVGFGPDFIWYHPRPRPSAMMLQGGFGDFYSIFLDEGRAGRNDLIRAAFKKAMSSPQATGFSFAIIRIKNQNAPPGFSNLDSKKTE